MNGEENEVEIHEPSKSERKRQMRALQELGEKLVQLDAGALASVTIEDEDLNEAIAVARRIKSREGLRRQMQYIGKLMRKIDTDAIHTRLDELAGGRRETARRFHALESLRDEALQDPHNGIEAILVEYPQADRQHLRQLVRRASQEASTHKPPAAARKLFRYLRELAEATLP